MTKAAKLAYLTPERWQALEPLLDAALALAPEPRTSFLDETCGSDALLREELAWMLAACERLDSEGSTLDRPAAERFASLWDEPDEVSRLQAALAERYVIEEASGRGGTAVVYRARDLRHDRLVALKVLRGTLSGHGPARFRREIALAANLQHPHILPVFDSGESAGRLWYSMPFVDGESLGARLQREKRLGVRETVRVLREIADALEYAHARGVVHRDLKPDNVLLSGGHAVIADFGVAKALAAGVGGALRARPDDPSLRSGQAGNREPDLHEESLFPVPAAEPPARRLPGPSTPASGFPEAPDTLTGVTVGTPTYMSPEQVAADPAIDHRADLYALGVIAYQLLAGVTPFTGATRDALFAAHVAERPRPVSTHRSDVPPALERLVMRLLEKRAEDRPSSAAEVVAELDTLATSSRKPRPGRHWILAASVVAAIAGAATWRAFAHPAPPPMRRVLVLPLRNESSDTSVMYFGRAARQLIADNLAQTGFVDVVDFVNQSTGAPKEIAAAAAESRAGLVVSGSYFVVGDSIQARLTVTDVASGTLLPGSTPVSVARTAKPDGLLPLVNQAMVMLATRLDPRIAQWSMGAPPTNMDAYRAFIEGLNENAAGHHAEGLAQWLRAAALDSTYAQPLLHAAAMLSGPFPSRADALLERVKARLSTLTPGDRAWYDAIRTNTDGNTTGFLEASQAIRRAEPGTPLPYFFIGIGAIRLHRPNTALEATKHIDFESGRFGMQWAGEVASFVVMEAYHQLERHDDELAFARHAVSLHPENRNLVASELRARAALGQLDGIDSLVTKLEAMPPAPYGPPLPSLLLVIAGELEYHGHVEDGRRLLRHIVASPQMRSAEESLGDSARFDVGRAFYFLERYDSAAAVFDALVRTDSVNPFRLAFAAVTASRLGQTARAADLGARLDSLRRRFDHGHTPYARALAAAQRGDTAAALALLQAALDRGVPPDGMSVHTDLALSPLWRSARFQGLLRPKD